MRLSTIDKLAGSDFILPALLEDGFGMGRVLYPMSKICKPFYNDPRARLNWVDIKITYPNVRYKSGMHLQLDQFTCVHSALCINANIDEMLHHGLYSLDFCCSLCK